MNKHYDIGVYGWWGHENFGGCLTYYALNQALKKMGYSVLMIQEANGAPSRYTIPDTCIAMKFAKRHYDCSPQVDIKELYKFNNICDKFIVGGDQLWNNLIPFVKEDNFLNFVRDDKLKLSYSTSFGTTSHNPPKDYLNKMAPLLQRFDAVSVREDYGVQTAHNLYNANATQVIDAVFLLDQEDYFPAMSHADVKLPEKYLLAYILNPTLAKRKQIEQIAKKLNLEPLCISDAASAYHKSFNEIFAGLNIMSSLSVDNFLKAYKNASYIITDSFHGICMSYVFKKDFSAYYNEQRGLDRFLSLMRILDLDSRRIKETQTIEEIEQNNNIGFNVDWANTDKNVKIEREFSYNWLKHALQQKPKSNNLQIQKNNSLTNNDIENLHNNPDFRKIRILATLLRDYGIKHIVLSPGGRDVPLIRMFESNEQEFILHRVTDERSAAYYGLGIATQLQKPVACVCTSGTAASNFLPAVTEAYYTGIPLIVITADRYEVYLNHGEDQTIPQKQIFNGVTKKEISLPEGGGWKTEYQTRRDISDCILETTHNGFGPVHINIPIDNISIGEKLPRAQWKLLPFIYPHILRVDNKNGYKELYKWVDALKKSPRILVVYGQNAPISEAQRKNIEKFASKFNCAIVTDHISNLNCKYCVKPFNMLRTLPQSDFNRELAPDILITVGGKKLMNDPLTFKVRGGLGNIRHWAVTPEGKVQDFYFRLSSVIEMSQDYFFEWFAEKAGEITNNGVYYDKWRKLTEDYKPNNMTAFNSLYIQNKFLPNVPANSILHLGVGQTFFECRRFQIDKSVEIYCNMGTNGIDGCTSTFMGQCAVAKDKLCFLMVGDLSFFYDMNSLWNKPLNKNMRILMINNNGSGLLRGHNLKAVTSVHNTSAEGWVKSTGFDYISAKNEQEFNKNLKYFLSDKPQNALFFEVFCE